MHMQALRWHQQGPVRDPAFVAYKRQIVMLDQEKGERKGKGC